MDAVDHLVQPRQSGDHAHWRAGAAVGGQAAHVRRGAKDRGEYRQAAGAVRPVIQGCVLLLIYINICTF
jgi:hypothetical protein